jgi:hypothetical protein
LFHERLQKLKPRDKGRLDDSRPREAAQGGKLEWRNSKLEIAPLKALSPPQPAFFELRTSPFELRGTGRAISDLTDRKIRSKTEKKD